MQVINTKKKMKKKKYVNSGTVSIAFNVVFFPPHFTLEFNDVLLLVFQTQVTLLSFSVESEFTFLDYIKGG